MSFKVEVIADNSGQWCSNQRVFATFEQAAAYARDLASRWVLVREWRVVPTADDQWPTPEDLRDSDTEGS